MFTGDLVIFINEHGSTMSFLRNENGVWSSDSVNGFPSDEDIRNIMSKDRMWIQIRGGFIVGLNLWPARGKVQGSHK